MSTEDFGHFLTEVPPHPFFASYEDSEPGFASLVALRTHGYDM